MWRFLAAMGPREDSVDSIYVYRLDIACDVVKEDLVVDLEE